MNSTSTSSLQQLQTQLREAIEQLTFERDPQELYDPISYILSLGGKRMRPLLVLLGCEIFSDQPLKSLPQALAVEIFHNFTLLHDDIMDQAPLRRNQPTVHEKWNPNIAILSGDVMLVIAYQHLMQCEPEFLPSLLKEFNACAIGVCEGQQMDMNFETADQVAIGNYLTMIGLKTAVLLGASLKMGAIIGGASERDAQMIYDFGYHTGVAFQLQDDILDVYGDKEKFGKRIGGDILSNKKTFLLLKALELAEGETLTELQNWIDATDPKPEAKVAGVTGIYDRLNVKEFARSEMDRYYQRGLDCLAAISVNETGKAGLRDFTDRLMVREH